MRRINDQERRYVLEVLDNGFRTSRNGIFTARLEHAFAERFGCAYALSFVNGTATLHTALHALGLGPGDEVIVPPLTMSSPALAVLHNGSVPVFADVDPDTFVLDARSVAKVITPRTKAVMCVALYGLPPDYDALLAVCREHGLALIEDNAECFLGSYKGCVAGVFGAFASFSFQASKHMTCGEGGMLITSNRELADRARQFSSLGYAGVGAGSAKISKADILVPDYARHVCLGFNYRISELQSAVALGQLERLDELVEARRTAASHFTQALRGLSCLKLQAVPPERTNSYWTFATALETADPARDWRRMRALFAEEGGDDVYAAWRLSYQEPFFLETVQHLPGIWQRYEPGLCPVAEYLQPRMFQFKTNYWEPQQAAVQAAALRRAAERFEQESA